MSGERPIPVRRFPSVISRWDEGVPLGNGRLGGLLWGGPGVFRLCLSRGDLWDLRQTENPSGEWFRYEEVIRLAKMGAAGREEFDEKFDAFYGACYPVKLPAGALLLGMKCQTPMLLDCRIAELTAGPLRAFVSAFDRLGHLRLVKGRAEDIGVEMPAYRPNGRAAGNSAVVEGNPLSLLGYPEAERQERDKLTVFLQRTRTELTYAVLYGAAEADGALELVWDVASSSDGEGWLEKSCDRVRAALAAGYGAALAEHAANWAEFWAKSGVRLPEAGLQEDWYFNNYLLKSCSARGEPPMPLQGLWQQDSDRLPPWKGDYHLDLNLQGCYWSYCKANHMEEGSAYPEFILKLRPAARRFAREFFQSPGYCLPGVMDLAGHPMGGWGQYSLSIGNQPWVCKALDDCYRYHPTEEFLAEAYEYLSGSAACLLHWLEEDTDGKLALPVSTSPEIFDNTEQAWLQPNSNYDLAGLRYLFSTLADYARILENGEARKWDDVLGRLPGYAVNGGGALMYDRRHSYRSSHRHFSHLMAIYPYGELRCDTPEHRRCIHASLDELERCGTQEWVGFSFAWMAALCAAGRRGERAAHYLTTFRECFLSPNGFHLNGDFQGRGVSAFRYRPFTLEGNFMFSCALQEMLLGDGEDRLELFPAVPEGWLAGVSFAGFLARGGLEVSAEAEGGRIVSCTVVNPNERPVWRVLTEPCGANEAAVHRPGGPVRTVRAEGGEFHIRLYPGENRISFGERRRRESE